MKLHPSSALFVCAGLLAFGVLPLPYGYYQLLRIAVFFTAAAATFIEWDRNKQATGWAYTFACMALLWNPFLPIHLAKLIWVIFDLVGACLMYLYWKGVTADLDEPKGKSGL